MFSRFRFTLETDDDGHADSADLSLFVGMVAIYVLLLRIGGLDTLWGLVLVYLAGNTPSTPGWSRATSTRSPAAWMRRPSSTEPAIHHLSAGHPSGGQAVLIFLAIASFMPLDGLHLSQACAAFRRKTDFGLGYSALSPTRKTNLPISRPAPFWWRCRSSSFSSLPNECSLSPWASRP